MPCMCGDSECWSCGAAMGTLRTGCPNCGAFHKRGSKREAKCGEFLKKAEQAEFESYFYEDRTFTPDKGCKCGHTCVQHNPNGSCGQCECKCFGWDLKNYRTLSLEEVQAKGKQS